MNWITTGQFVWCVELQIVHNYTWSRICEGPHRQVAALLHSPDEYLPPKEKNEVTLQIEDNKGSQVVVPPPVLDPAKKYLCDNPAHIENKSVCTNDQRGRGWTSGEVLRLESLRHKDEIVLHHWVEFKPIPKEETSTGKKAVENQVTTSVMLRPDKYYCHAYEHVQRREKCAIYGLAVVPLNSAENGHNIFNAHLGNRSHYIKYAEPLDAIPVDVPKEFAEARQKEVEELLPHVHGLLDELGDRVRKEKALKVEPVIPPHPRGEVLLTKDTWVTAVVRLHRDLRENDQFAQIGPEYAIPTEHVLSAADFPPEPASDQLVTDETLSVIWHKVDGGWTLHADTDAPIIDWVTLWFSHPDLKIYGEI